MVFSARLLNDGDKDRFDALLCPHTPFAFFLRSNEKVGGLAYKGQPYQADYIGTFDGETLIGVLSHSWIGTVQLFTIDMKAIPAMANALQLLRAQNPREITAFLGPELQVAYLLEALGLSAEKFRGGLKKIEGLFSLDMAEMSMPTDVGTVRCAEAKDADILIPWRHDFYVESLGDQPGAAALARANDEISRRIQEKQLYVMEVDGQLVSFCGVHGFLSEWKSVGPVWTPPDQRGKQYARIVVAKALLALQLEGATKAVLFTENPFAERAYRALGFKRVGDWHLDFLKQPTMTL